MPPRTRKNSLLAEVKRSAFRQSDLLRTKVVQYAIKTKSYSFEDESEDEDEDEEDDDDDTEHIREGAHRVELIFDEIMERVVSAEGITRNDHVGMSIYGGDLVYPINLPIRMYHSPEAQRRMLMNTIELLQQSKRDWLMGGSLDITVTTTKDVKARGRPPTTMIMTPELMQNHVERGLMKDMGTGHVNQDVIKILLRHHRIECARTESTPWSEEEFVATLVQKEHTEWKEVLKQWCILFPQTNVIVLSQRQGPGTYHEVIWKSAFSCSEDGWVMWYEEPLKMYDVLIPNQLYNVKGHHRFCYQCGKMFYCTTRHTCGEEVTRVPHRPGRKRPHYKCTEQQKAAKVSRKMDSEENNCMGRALFFALTELGHEDRTTLDLEAWYEEMGMKDTWNVPSGMQEAKQWQKAIDVHYAKEGFGFEVCMYDEKERQIIATFADELKRKRHQLVTLYLNVEEYHVTWIRSMAAWLGYCYFCNRCKKGYARTDRHKCVRPCLMCGEEKNDHFQSNHAKYVTCRICHRQFWSEMCYRAHLVRRVKESVHFSMCERKQKCMTCGVTIDRLKRESNKIRNKLRLVDDHVCYEYNCPTCGKKKAIRGHHQCYVKPKKVDKDEDHSFHLAFFDFETRTLEDHHVVNKVVVLLTCYECASTVEQYETVGCTGMCGRKRLWIFNTVKEFMDWLLGEHYMKHINYTFLAHNLKGYDSYPILEECVARGILPHCIKQGAKVITMTIRTIQFKDSLCFIPMALRKFPSTFGTSGGEKGYFPHFFNTLENEHYVGPYPALEYYGIDEMSEGKEREELVTWWREQEGKTFDLQQELEKYCIQDVMVMARGCLKFRQLYADNFHVNPFSDCLTIAATCLDVFKTNYLKPNRMGVVPPLGYRQKDIQSAEALEWLHSLNLPSLEWAGSSSGEKVVCGAKVDGYDPTTKTVYQYHGCYWHGCDVCFKDRRLIHAHLGLSMHDLLDKTQSRTRQLRAQGYRVVEMWGHVWDVLRLQLQFEPPTWIKDASPTQPRDGMFGGRTDAVQLYARTKDVPLDEDDMYDVILYMIVELCWRMYYDDVVSLYPTVMYEEEYPVGHPTIYLKGEVPDMATCTQWIVDGTWFGMIRCNVDPPSDLMFPVLPRIFNHKLMFVLCARCAEDQNSEECTHSLEERRMYHGVWTTPELKKALTRGYVLQEVHEVWHYEERSQDLFQEYIRDNLKFKMEASGWPAYCTTEESKRQFVEDVKKSHGAELRYENVVKNIGMRSIAKLNLNSLWGKFAQNPFRSKVEYINSPERYFELLYDDTVDVKSVVLLSERMVQVNYEEIKENVHTNPNGNVVVASFVTSYARLRLHQKMEQLGDRVLYHDTDSVIYKAHPDDPPPVHGDRLGDWSYECGDPNDDWIVEFVALGPKTYAYRTKKGECVVKCKGISLTPDAKKIVDMKSMKRLLVDQNDKITVTYPRKIVRDSLKKQLKTVSMNKDVRMTSSKRRRIGNGLETVPYGYITPASS